jgi:hypothetical protein
MNFSIDFSMSVMSVIGILLVLVILEVWSHEQFALIFLISASKVARIIGHRLLLELIIFDDLAI